MKTSQDIKVLFNALPVGTQNELLVDLLIEQELKGKVLEEASQIVVKKRNKKPCPHCSSAKVYRRGKQRGIQMYRCNDCSKWYSETTGTPLYDIKLKSKWQSYLNCMEQGMPIKKIAAKLNISIQTSFDWRHKILSSLSQFTPTELSGQVECDELELALSSKGSKSLERKPKKRGTDFKRNQGKDIITTVQVVTAVQRNGEKYLRAVQTKRLSKKDIEKVFEGKLADNTTLITDKHHSYKAFAKDNPSIKHKSLLAKDHVDEKDKTIHLQSVNNTHKQVREFLKPFNGVSSKYLQNYLNWYAYMDKIRNSKTMIKQWFVTMLLIDQAYSLFELFKQNAVIIRT
ncbi:MAG: IS1595 family transposase [Flavobacteriaceae bacterium]|nr:IS1595 family transposase [Flavobacteriaceae bacterium]